MTQEAWRGAHSDPTGSTALRFGPPEMTALLVMGLKEVPMRAEEPAGTADRRPERVAADRALAEPGA